MNFLAVISVHNGEATIGRAVESVLREDMLVLVVNDGSTDGTESIVRRLGGENDGIAFVGLPKSGDWQEQLAGVVSLYGIEGHDWIVGLGADDFLLPGFADAVRPAPPSPVMWTDYYFVNARGQATGVSASGFVADTRLTPKEVQDLFADKTNPFAPAWRPSGVGCAVRADIWLDMMLKREAWRLGPSSDTIGINVAACEHGATLIPKKLAAFTRSESSYSATQFCERREKIAQESAAYLVKHGMGNGINPDALDGIFTKWFPEYKKQTP